MWAALATTVLILLPQDGVRPQSAGRNSDAQPFVPETTSNIWVLTWQRPLKNGPRLYLKCDCRPG